MSAEKNFTFELQPNQSFRYNAGPYEKTTHAPKYEIEVSVPTHVRQQVEIKQFLMGSEGNFIWVWDIKNNSSWPAFFIVKKDGVLLRDIASDIAV